MHKWSAVVLFSLIVVSGCSSTGNLSGFSNSVSLQGSCEGAGLIINGMIYEGNLSSGSVKAVVSNTGDVALTLDAILYYPEGESETKAGIGVIEPGVMQESFIIPDVGSDVDRISIVSVECKDMMDWLSRIHIIGLG